MILTIMQKLAWKKDFYAKEIKALINTNIFTFYVKKIWNIIS